VFREGLRVILVLARSSESEPTGMRIAADRVGVLLAMRPPADLAHRVGVLDDSPSDYQRSLQAATGLVAVIVLVVVMNGSFTRLLDGWIAMHTTRKKHCSRMRRKRASLRPASCGG